MVWNEYCTPIRQEIFLWGQLKTEMYWATGPQNIFLPLCDKMILISIIAMWAILFKVPFQLLKIILLYKYM